MISSQGPSEAANVTGRMVQHKQLSSELDFSLIVKMLKWSPVVPNVTLCNMKHKKYSKMIMLYL